MFFKRISGRCIMGALPSLLLTTLQTRVAQGFPKQEADCGNMLQFQTGTNMVITHRGKWEVPKESA